MTTLGRRRLRIDSGCCRGDSLGVLTAGVADYRLPTTDYGLPTMYDEYDKADGFGLFDAVLLIGLAALTAAVFVDLPALLEALGN